MALSLFGKHPAWSDHMPTHGEQTGILVDFQQTLYIRGIGECLSRERWEAIGQGGEQIPYAHWVLSIGAKGIVLAFCAATSDAKGRRQYPLVTAMAGPDIGGFARMDDTCGFLQRLSVSAAAASDEKAVTQVFESSMNREPSFQAGSLDKASFFEKQNTDAPALARIFHALSVHGAGYRNARVPFSGNGMAPLWLSLAASILEEEAGEMTLIWQDGKEFADLFLHPPDIRSLGYLFTGLETRPLSSTVAYRLADGWESTCSAGIAQWAGQAERTTDKPTNSPTGQVGNWWSKKISGIFRQPKS